MQHEFCMKTTSNVDDYTWTWPAGSYCIYKKGSCPADFTSGYIYWDDEDDNNGNSYSGTRPDGSYGSNTKIEFCCREDGIIDNAIFLPTANSFYLLARFQHCRRVNGMTAIDEYFRWDNENSNN